VFLFIHIHDALYGTLCCRVSDEKDARGYLQALATKMTEELENLKIMGVSGDDVSQSLLVHICPTRRLSSVKNIVIVVVQILSLYFILFLFGLM
jgi:hypothetical protein